MHSHANDFSCTNVDKISLKQMSNTICDFCNLAILKTEKHANYYQLLVKEKGSEAQQRFGRRSNNNIIIVQASPHDTLVTYNHV